MQIVCLMHVCSFNYSAMHLCCVLHRVRARCLHACMAKHYKPLLLAQLASAQTCQSPSLLGKCLYGVWSSLCYNTMLLDNTPEGLLSQAARGPGFVYGGKTTTVSWCSVSSKHQPMMVLGTHNNSRNYNRIALEYVKG